MSTIYSIPTRDDIVYSIIDVVTRKWHQRLHDAQVRFGVLFAANEDGPAIKHGGDPALALIRILALKWRVLTNYDALIEIDENEWKDLEDDSRVALIDHELSHIDTVAKEGFSGNLIVQRDDIGRPKLKTRPGDWLSSDGFLDVVKRHGPAACEAISIRRAHGMITAAIQESLNEESDEKESDDALLS